MQNKMQTLDFWLRKISSDLPVKEQIPYFPIDLNAISKTLMNKWNLPINIVLRNSEWKNKENLLDGFNQNVNKCAMLLSPVSSVLFLITNDDIAILNQIFQKELDLPSLQHSLYNFFLLEILNATQPFIPNFSLKLEETEKFTDEEALCFDLEISINDKPSIFRLITPLSFHRELKKLSPQTFLPPAASYEVPIHFEIGNVVLDKNSIDTMQIDDFLLLDRITYDLNNQKGRAILKLQKYPFFHVKISQNKIQILDHALYHEENNIMENKEEELPIEGQPQETLNVEQEEITPFKDVNFDIKVELAKCSISMEKLIQLQPGNVLELNITTPDKVDLTLNEKTIAKGELLYLGDALGVKIIETFK